MEIDISINELTNCLISSETGEECDTEYCLVARTISKNNAKILKVGTNSFTDLMSLAGNVGIPAFVLVDGSISLNPASVGLIEYGIPYVKGEIIVIKRFKEPAGRCLTKIIGQDRLGFAMTDTSDMYDLIEWAKRGGYQGSNIQFYDFENGNVYRPFEKKRDVIYEDPAYFNGFYYILQGDYEDKKVRLYKYIPEEVLQLVTEINLEEVNLFNLRLVGDEIHIISQKPGEEFKCYYPEIFSFNIEPNETVTFIEDGKVYIDAWIEEGWNDQDDCATDEYKFYGKVIVKDFEGNTLSEEIGSLYQGQDGIWWIA